MKYLLRALLPMLLAASLPATTWGDPDDVTQASAAALAWMAQIDAGQYDESYDAASHVMHDKVKQDRWDLILQVERTPKGKVVQRTETKRVYRPNGLEGTDGEFMVLTYATTFQNSPGQLEQVVLRREDGVWKGAGYILGPADAEASAEHPPDSDTTTSSSTMSSGAPVTPLPTDAK